MTQVLTAYAVRRATARLDLRDAARRHLDQLVELLSEEGVVSVGTIHERLFGLNGTASANRALARLVEEVNASALAKGRSLRMCLSPLKRGGASARSVWFEGPETSAPIAVTDELDALTTAQIVDQFAVDTTAPTAVILTFNKHETRAVRDLFKVAGPQRGERREGIEYVDLGTCGGFRVVHAVSGQGQAAAQTATEAAVRQWNPKVLIATGIAFGVDPARQRIGDVLVASALWGYELGRLEPNGTLTPRGVPMPTSWELVQRVQELDHRRGDHSWPTVHLGSVLSGNKLVDNLSYRDGLASLANQTVGGDMEGLAVQTVCARWKVDSILIKGISDWGDGGKSNPHKVRDQREAARNAAYVVRAVLEDGPLAIVPGTGDAGRPQRPDRGCEAPTLGAFEPGFDVVVGSKALLQETRAATLSMDKAAPPPGDTEGAAVVASLLEWAGDTESPQIFALMGEYGMGKSVTCQRFLKSQLALHKGDPSQRVALYFDLKRLARVGEAHSLRATVVALMRDAWSPHESPEYTWGAFLNWLRRGAVVIFDGLDEVLVKLDEADGINFTRMLLGVTNVLPADEDPPIVKVLVTCRTQYFPTLRDQRNHFIGAERSKLTGSSFRAMTLLPLSDDQIWAYLAAVLPRDDIDAAMALVRSVHNLGELAQRPYSLKVISEQIPQLERLRAEGRPIFGATLYRLMVEQWLDRDALKHRIRRDHKPELMAHLSGYLWENGMSGLPASALNDWFHDWRSSSERLVGYYATVSLEQLEAVSYTHLTLPTSDLV